jgi:hypothetical protein
MRLDGERKLLIDPTNVGREGKSYVQPQPASKTARVPDVVQEVFPEYYGVACFWRDFTPPTLIPAAVSCCILGLSTTWRKFGSMPFRWAATKDPKHPLFWTSLKRLRCSSFTL